MNSRPTLSRPSQLEFLKYLGPAVVLFIIIVMFGPQIVEMGSKLIDVDDSSDESVESDESDESPVATSSSGDAVDDSLARSIRRETRRYQRQRRRSRTRMT